MNKIELKKISERMKTQDNRSTADPIFIVYEWEKVSSHSDYTDKYAYIHSEGEIGLTKESVISFCKDNGYELPENINEMDEYDFESWIEDHEEFSKWYYQKIRKFVGVFFTEIAAQQHIDANHYHYKKPHIYVHCLWRNPEMQAIRLALIEGRFIEKKEIP